jgi:hypothetical protein
MSRSELTPEIQYVRTITCEITPEIQYIRTITCEITPEIQYIRTITHEITEIEYVQTITCEIRYVSTIEGGSYPCDPLVYPPWTSNMGSDKKTSVCPSPHLRCNASYFLQILEFILGDTAAANLMDRTRADAQMVN